MSAQLHVALREAYPPVAQTKYTGVRMVDETDMRSDLQALLVRRMNDYRNYVARGGVLSVDDMSRTSLFETE